MRPFRFSLSLLAIAALSGCARDSATFTLYRASALDVNARIHVATFDAREDEGYNRGNCDTARQLFANQPGVSVRYWCEKGRFRP